MLKKAWLIMASIVGVVAGVIAVIQYFESYTSVELNGEWMIKNTVESGPFSGIELEFKFFLMQDGKKFNGTGEKWKENGTLLPPARRTPINIVNGIIDSNNIRATFVESGHSRKTRGEFRWIMTDDGKLVGTYSSSASSNGQSIGIKRN